MDLLKQRELLRIATEGRMHALRCVYEASSGHPGGSMSCMDILTVLYFDVMHIDPQNPKDPDRDRFVLSKGHCTPALYSILAMRGYFPLSDLHLFRQLEGHYSGHPDMTHVSGVDMSTGSLGQGLSAAIGMAMAGKADHKDYRVYALLGDGEIEEGQTWEAAMAAAKFHLDNLCAIVDVNGLQIDGRTEDVMPSSPLGAKYSAFGWHVIHIDGHNPSVIHAALMEAQTIKNSPVMILADTVKGKGISYMENQAGWHGKAPNAEQFQQGIDELTQTLKALEDTL